MRKFLVKLLNLVYLAGAVLAVWAFCTKPMISTSAGISLTSEQVADKLIQLFKESNNEDSAEEESAEKSSYKLVYRDGSTEENVTREDIMNAFPDGFSLSLTLKIEAKDALNYKNKDLLKKSIADSLDESLNGIVNTVSTSLRNLVKTVTERFAKEELTKQIDAQIQAYFSGASGVDSGDVDKVYENVYNSLDGKTVTVEDLATTIVGTAGEDGKYPEGTLLYILEKKKEETGTGLVYVVADPQPKTEEEFNAGEFYKEVETVDPEDSSKTIKTYELITSWDPEFGAKYYIQKYDTTTVSGDDIADKLADSLNSIPGLVEVKTEKVENLKKEEFDATLISNQYFYRNASDVFVNGNLYDETLHYYTITKPEVQPEEAVVRLDIDKSDYGLKQYVIETEGGYIYPAEYNSEATYYELNVAPLTLTEEQYNATLVSTKYMLLVDGSYVYASSFNSEAEYYAEVKIVNDVNTALTKLLESMIGESSSETKAIYRTEGESSDEDKLTAAIKNYIQSLLPMDQVYAMVEKADQYSAYIGIGIIALFAFPWALFGLVTIIRTLRRRKIWTKPWIVFFFAFIQVIFGIVLTYGLQYAMPLIAKYVPKFAEILESTQLTVGLKTGCLIPSFVYVAFIPLTIVYAIIAHPLKYEYKMWKRYGRYRQIRRR